MSNMLEQAIADAAALREQAIRNAEQSVLDKYSKQIKEAVDQMLESDDVSSRVNDVISEAEEELMQEEEMAMGGGEAAGGGAAVEAPAAWDSRFDDISMKLTAMVDNLPEDENGMVELDLGDLEIPQDEIAAADGAPEDPLGDLSSDLESEPAQEPSEGGEDDLDSLLGDLGGQDDGGDDLDLQLQEVLNMLNEETNYDQEPVLTGNFDIGSPNQKHNAKIAKAIYDEDSEEDSEESEDDMSEEFMGRINELHETVESLTRKNTQLERVLSKLEEHLDETLLSNAKLLYQNRTLGDASLNERQKSKIVEAIANAESPKEAKRLHETLKATVGSTPNSNKGPQSLSESVNRRSNLSAMLNSRQNINESKQSVDPFLEKMQKLAGIKK
jgi:hypothetical protein